MGRMAHKVKDNAYRYFVRTDKNGGDIGDTSDMTGHPNDFAYELDKTCDSGYNPRAFVQV